MRGALVLAGGRSSRFGSTKALARLDGKPLIMHAVDKALRSASEVVVAVGIDSNIATYKKLLPKTVRVMKDRIHAKSPLVGIVTGFHVMKSEFSLVLSCDTPFINEAVLELLFKRATHSQAAIPKWADGDIEPLQAVYKTKPAAAAARLALNRDQYRITDMIRRLEKVTYVSVSKIKAIDPNLTTFFNVNSRSDLKRASSIYKALGGAQAPSTVS